MTSASNATSTVATPEPDPDLRPGTVPLIGVEEHWTTPELTAALLGLPEGEVDQSLAFNDMGDHRVRLEDIGDARIEAMDEQGIEMHVLGLAPPGTGPLAPGDAVALSRATNDIAVEAVRRHPGRLRAMSTLPMAAPEAVAAELSGMFNPALLRHALTATSVDRLLFSTDYPFQHPSRADLQCFLAEFDTDQERVAFGSGNACRLFGLTEG